MGGASHALREASVVKAISTWLVRAWKRAGSEPKPQILCLVVQCGGAKEELDVRTIHTGDQLEDIAEDSAAIAWDYANGLRKPCLARWSLTPDGAIKEGSAWSLQILPEVDPVPESAPVRAEDTFKVLPLVSNLLEKMANKVAEGNAEAFKHWGVLLTVAQDQVKSADARAVAALNHASGLETKLQALAEENATLRKDIRSALDLATSAESVAERAKKAGGLARQFGDAFAEKFAEKAVPLVEGLMNGAGDMAVKMLGGSSSSSGSNGAAKGIVDGVAEAVLEGAKNG